MAKLEACVSGERKKSVVEAEVDWGRLKHTDEVEGEASPEAAKVQLHKVEEAPAEEEAYARSHFEPVRTGSEAFKFTYISNYVVCCLGTNPKRKT